MWILTVISTFVSLNTSHLGQKRSYFLEPQELQCSPPSPPLLYSFYIKKKKARKGSSTLSFNLFHLLAHKNWLLKFCSTTKNMFFADLTKNRYNFDSSFTWTAIVVLAVVIFIFDSLREKRSVPLTKQAGVACLKNSCSTLVKNCWPSIQIFPEFMLSSTY